MLGVRSLFLLSVVSLFSFSPFPFFFFFDFNFESAVQRVFVCVSVDLLMVL